MAEGNGRHWTEQFRILTPLLLLSLNLLAGMVLTNQVEMRATIMQMDSKMFSHLTNANIHIPRETVVSKDEFVIYQTMRDKQMSSLNETLCRIEGKIDAHMNTSR